MPVSGDTERGAGVLGPAALTDLEETSMSDDDLLVGEATALRAFFDVSNLRRVGVTLWLMALIISVYAVVMFVSGFPARGVLATVVVIGDLVLLRFRHRPALSANIRQTVAGVLLFHLVVIQIFNGSASGGVGFWFVVFPIIAARFRLSPGEAVALFSSLYAVVAVRLVGESLVMRQAPPLLNLVLYALVYLVCFALSWGLSRRQEARFSVRWRSESARHHDRLRMKQELEYAREIQLSMLPRQAPEVEWLDIAALSLPATEVGGDYYDYFDLDSGRLAVVVGDVTGHGVASGLVLSGVRSSLNLLRDDMERPSAVLDRVNLMLKRTSAPRMHMTLAVAVLDRQAMTVTVATAGHPPVLIRRRNDGVLEVGSGSFPLGAMEHASYVEDRIDLAHGDVLVVYSDGLVETIDPGGDQYGWERLVGLLESLDGEVSANEIRDLILRELWTFKGDAHQVDDVTMVVIRIRDSGSAVAPAVERRSV